LDPWPEDLIAEAALEIEMGADAADIGLTIHPIRRFLKLSAWRRKAFEGTITDLYMPRKK
jgi:dihydrolipoamide dehydrogenase